MISDEVVQRIRRYRSEGVSLREISRATGISVNTIRRYLADPMLGMVPRPKQIRKSKLDILAKESFESIYRACKGNCAAIALAVKLMLQETQPEFSVSRSAVRRYLLSRYPELRPQKLDPVPLDVILTFATPSTFHGVAKHAIFAGVQRQRRSAPAEQGAQHL